MEDGEIGILLQVGQTLPPPSRLYAHIAVETAVLPRK
jgi:hypothetical protein